MIEAELEMTGCLRRDFSCRTYLLMVRPSKTGDFPAHRFPGFLCFVFWMFEADGFTPFHWNMYRE
jgi:hypothetical protein